MKMDTKTLKALEDSIEKWKKNVAAESPADVTTGWRECPLCLLYNNLDKRDNAIAEWYATRCHGCPVFEQTRQQGCHGSPYNDAEDAHDDWVYHLASAEEDKYRDAFRAAAKLELKFLESLLPEQSNGQV
jgi:hypothetical protein